ncbi:phosphate ABC transporter substrate-binding protein PstS family protein [Alteromonadaceae bacterium M269]|nr:phosphate ABC transporter substrate-binding protein PstS family protein [Alteromonadaceae bacterium M269]
MLKRLLRKFHLALVIISCSTLAWGDDYEPVPGVDGKIISVGSDTLASLMTFWAEGFKQQYPNVNIQIQASGSSTAPPALTEGTANIGPMSRPLKPSEISYFVEKYGYEPTVLKVAIDAIAVFVNKQNALDGLSLKQLDSLFSVTRYCGYGQQIKRWRELNPESSSKGVIELYGRNSVSGTYGLFKQVALCNGDFKAEVNEQPGSAAVVQSVAYSKQAIGYAAFGYKTAGVRMLPLSIDKESYIHPTTQTIADGSYPLSRFLYLVVNKAPSTPLPRLEKEFIRYILSSQGQNIVKRVGYIPLSQKLIEQQVIEL